MMCITMYGSLGLRTDREVIAGDQTIDLVYKRKDNVVVDVVVPPPNNGTARDGGRRAAAGGAVPATSSCHVIMTEEGRRLLRTSYCYTDKSMNA